MSIVSSSWICTKCGVTMYSKCPNQRSIFINDMEVSMVDNLFTIDKLKGKDSTEVFVTYSHYGDSSPIDDFVDTITKYAAKLKQSSCNHDWVLNTDDDTADCQFDCGHRNKNAPKEEKTPFEHTQVTSAHEAARILNRAYTVAMRQITSFYPRIEQVREFNEDASTLINPLVSKLNNFSSDRKLAPDYLVSSYDKDWNKTHNFATDNKVLAAAVYEAIKEHTDHRCSTKVKGEDGYFSNYAPSRVATKCPMCNQSIIEGDNLKMVEGAIVHSQCIDDLTTKPRNMTFVRDRASYSETYSYKDDPSAAVIYDLPYSLRETVLEVKVKLKRSRKGNFTEVITITVACTREESRTHYFETLAGYIQ